jgi:hypothetical protein
VRLAGYEIDLGLFGQDAGRRAATADSPQSGSPPEAGADAHDPKAHRIDVTG